MRDANGPQTVFLTGFRGQGVVEHFAVFRHSQRRNLRSVNTISGGRISMLSSMVKGKQTQHGQYGQQAKLYVRRRNHSMNEPSGRMTFYCLQIPVA